MSSRKPKCTTADPADLTLLAIAREYSTEDQARAYFEALRWPHGPSCPYCGNKERTQIYKVTPNAKVKTRPGLYKCAACAQHFTVTVGTVMHDSHIPLTKWLLGFYLMCSAKTQVSALQMQRQLELGSYRTAWHMCHRIRYALADLEPETKLTGEVEADETYIGGKARGKGRAYVGNKTAVVSVVERGGEVRSRVMRSERVSGDMVSEVLLENIDASANLYTDDSGIYTEVGKEYTSHDTVNHSIKEYARQDLKTGRLATTNTAEGFFGNSKRSLDGTHHHVSKKHLPLYMAELDHKYNTRKVSDGERTVLGIKKTEGKRLTLKPLSGSQTVDDADF